jgi:hypothetical protein
MYKGEIMETVNEVDNTITGTGMQNSATLSLENIEEKAPEIVRKFMRAGCTVMIQKIDALIFGQENVYEILTGRQTLQLSPNELRALADFLEQK